jgi:hypothetical protein
MDNELENINNLFDMFLKSKKNFSNEEKCVGCGEIHKNENGLYSPGSIVDILNTLLKNDENKKGPYGPGSMFDILNTLLKNDEKVPSIPLANNILTKELFDKYFTATNNNNNNNASNSAPNKQEETVDNKNTLSANDKIWAKFNERKSNGYKLPSYPVLGNDDDNITFILQKYMEVLESLDHMLTISFRIENSNISNELRLIQDSIFTSSAFIKKNPDFEMPFSTISKFRETHGSIKNVPVVDDSSSVEPSPNENKEFILTKEEKAFVTFLRSNAV